MINKSELRFPDKCQPLKNGWHFSAYELVNPSGDAFGPDRLLSVTEVAQIRGSFRQSILASIKKGNIIAHRAGNQWVIYAAHAVKAVE